MNAGLPLTDMLPGDNPFGYCPNHATGVKLPADFLVTPLAYVD